MALTDLSVSGFWNNPGAGINNTAGISVTSPNPPFYNVQSGSSNGHLVAGFESNANVPAQLVGAVPNYIEIVWRPNIPSHQSAAIVGLKYQVRFTSTSSGSSFSFWRTIYTSPLADVTQNGISRLWAVTVNPADLVPFGAYFNTGWGFSVYDSVAGVNSAPFYSVDFLGVAAQFVAPTPKFFKAPPVLAIETP